MDLPAAPLDDEDRWRGRHEGLDRHAQVQAQAQAQAQA